MNKKAMHTYYCVTTTITDDGCFCMLTALVAAEMKPENKVTHTARADYYADWFDSEEEAKAFVKANKPQGFH